MELDRNVFNEWHKSNIYAILYALEYNSMLYQLVKYAKSKRSIRQMVIG